MPQPAKWFRKAAEQNQAGAQHNLGMLYLAGRGVGRDYRQAAEWFRKSAEQDYSRAQAGLGYLYEHGTGVPLDYVEAYKWYSLAAAHNDERGKTWMKALAQIMTETQMQAARAGISNWRAEHEGY
jgi:TPR repeat protein